MAGKVVWKLTKLSARFGLAGSLVYYTNQEGLWGTPEQSITFYYSLHKNAPETETIIPKEVSEKVLATAKKVAFWSDPDYIPMADRWNDAVFKSINFLTLLPNYISKWTNLSTSKE